MNHLALYRKYRPKSFDQVIGQDHITTTLKNQITSGQVSHAYLFTGTRGTGKTSIAKVFAQAVNCENSNNGIACNTCSTCIALNQPNNIDIMEIDAASNNRVDEIRELREKVKYPPVNGKYKVYIIDEVHMLTESAFNALLKTLEEPPSYVIFILATTEVQKLPATILSRCLRFDFKLVDIPTLTKHLKHIFEDSGVKYEDAALNLIASLGEGSVRDTLSIADMCVAYTNKMVTYNSVLEAVGAIDKSVIFELGKSILKGNSTKTLEIINNLTNSGKNPIQIAKDLTVYYKDLAVVKTLNGYDKILSLPKNLLALIEEFASNIEIEKVMLALKEFSKLDNEFRYTLNPKLLLEIKALTFSENVNKLDDVIKRLENVENALSALQKKSKDINVGVAQIVDTNPFDSNIREIVKNEFSGKEFDYTNNVSKFDQIDEENIIIDDVSIEYDNYVDINSESINDLKFLTPPSEEEISEILGFDNIDFNDVEDENHEANISLTEVSARSILGRLLVELRKRNDFILHSLLGTVSNFKYKDNVFTIAVYEDSKLVMLTKPNNFEIIQSIVNNFVNDIKVEVIKIEKDTVKKQSMWDYLIKLFGDDIKIRP